MKLIVYINRGLLLFTAILFLTIWYGLIAQILLGAFQVICSLALIYFWKHLSLEQKRKLKMYWVFLAIYSIGWLFDYEFIKPEILFFITTIIVLPMTLAVYFTLLIENIKTKLYENANT